jgi:SAM-dependent methyltransferase
MSDSNAYGEAFYSDRHALTRSSAQIVVQAVSELIQPKSVVDLGCGVGTWLSVFKAQGSQEVLGLDGPYVKPELLEIPRECFLPFDLSTPVRLEREFDLAMSVEVAEHLQAQHAPQFVASLTRLAPVVLFSAAIPFQGGIQHVNEQWPDYWDALFEREGFVCIDALRSALWNRAEVFYWYRQNALLFVRRSHLEQHPVLQRMHALHGGVPRALVHPESYLLKCAPASVRAAAASVAQAVGRAVRTKFPARAIAKGDIGR